ncbi:MAG: SsrA-binding protein [Anaerolineae bacterium SM23_84]|jgi:SsrA-binding protein|nr:MAG: SsrA-binding protein [Anaerolineae bacterium SM23_84]
MSQIKTIATNRKARHDYFLYDTYEAGMVLTGTEIKSIRAGRVNLRDSYVAIRDGQAWLVNVHIAPYSAGSRENPDPRRDRKLLLHRREINRLQSAVQEKGLTIVPLRLYMKNNRAKVEIALARGKKLYDKRAAIEKKETQRRIEREIKAQQR